MAPSVVGLQFHDPVRVARGKIEHFCLKSSDLIADRPHRKAPLRGGSLRSLGAALVKRCHLDASLGLFLGPLPHSTEDRRI